MQFVTVKAPVFFFLLTFNLEQNSPRLLSQERYKRILIFRLELESYKSSDASHCEYALNLVQYSTVQYSTDLLVIHMI